MAESEEELKELLDVTNEEIKERGLRIEVDQTKSKVVTKTVKKTSHVRLAGKDKQIRPVCNFNYLGNKKEYRLQRKPS